MEEHGLLKDSSLTLNLSPAMVLRRPTGDPSSGKTGAEAVSLVFFFPSSHRNELPPRLHAINVNVKCNGLYLGHAAAQVVSVRTDIREFQSESESVFFFALL